MFCFFSFGSLSHGKTSSEVDTLEEAIAIENANPYGNAAAIYTMSGQTALETEPGNREFLTVPYYILYHKRAQNPEILRAQSSHGL